MEPSQAALADCLNRLVDGGRVTVTEAAEGIAVYQLTGAEAEAVLQALEAAGWTEAAAEDAGGEIARDLVAGTANGVRVTAIRPGVPANVEAVLTQAGLAALLNRPPRKSVVWVEGITDVVDTLSIRYAPWGSSDEFEPADDVPNPARVVRILGGEGPGDHLGRWVLRSPDTKVEDDALKPWRALAAQRLLASLAQEVEADGTLLFRGPPPTRFAQTGAAEIDPDSFAHLQALAQWIFENDRELENRHGLVAAEIARTSLRGGTLADLAGALDSTLEGAKIAYNFGIAQQSRDTLKALGDLRKAVSDDAAKLSETTRGLAAAVVGAVFGNIGLIVARLTLPANAVFIGPAAKLLAAVLAIYVVAIIASGWHLLAIQQSLRKDWRNHLYRFLSDADYDRMVEKPARAATRAFWAFAGVGLLMTVMTVVAALRIADSSSVQPSADRAVADVNGVAVENSADRAAPLPARPAQRATNGAAEASDSRRAVRKGAEPGSSATTNR